jgi:hypothetical protein
MAHVGFFAVNDDGTEHLLLLLLLLGSSVFGMLLPPLVSYVFPRRVTVVATV